jgi:predicted helicase
MPENTAEIFNKYIDNIRREYVTGVAREHAYRPALKELFEALAPGTIAINDPARQKLGAPDFQIENSIDYQLRQAKIFASPPLAFVEHKDLTEDLDRPEHQNQLKRYLRLGNVLHTNGLIFRFYIKDQKPLEIILAELATGEGIIVDSAQYNQLALAYHNLIETKTLTIRTPLKLATLMAERAQAIRDIIESALVNDLKSDQETELTSQFKVFKSQLVHDLDEHKFADLYAQTLAYGLFAARYNDKSLSDFTLTEAAKIMPPTNRFLRKFFHEIAGYEHENRINWVLDNLVEIFNRVNVRELMQGAGEEWAKHHDPIIHFYETFLGLYDPKLRKSMGVYYTPQPIVKYIVSKVDEILKQDFSIIEGLADDSKIDREIKGQPMSAADKRRGYSVGKMPVHKVQILDPALGTGTFLNEVIKRVSKQIKPRLGSGWSKYVERDLLPRLYGFELMMAPYAMANLRLNLTLAETGYKVIDRNARLRVLLTNSLEAPNNNQLNQLQFVGFQQILATEAQEADIVKSNHNVMIVLGNPPYNISSNNKSDFIQNLIKEYKKNLNEKKINLDDDYIKFIRFAEDMILKNGEGIVAMITNNSYLDGITHREMRKHLLESFDKIFILDLHGSGSKLETGGADQDENVFSIRQGVAIAIMVKKSSQAKHELGTVFFGELHGRKEMKFQELANGVPFKVLDTRAPGYFFTPKDFSLKAEYDGLISLAELMKINNSGVKTDRDSLFIDFKSEVLSKRVETLLGGFDKEFAARYRVADSGSYKITHEIKKVDFDSGYIKPIQYRPFDNRWVYYDPKLISRPGYLVGKHLINNTNVALVTSRQFGSGKHFICFLTDKLIEISSQPFAPYNVRPLYIYHDDGTKTANFDHRILKKLMSNITITYEPEDILDYIYAVLNTPRYREEYSEFLKIDFPRLPAPKSNEEFKRLVEVGTQLRETHLLKDPTLDQRNFTPSGDGDWSIQKITFQPTSNSKGNVYVNGAQYFAGVPESAWNLYIGGYQPAQKWLKDRKGRELSHQDIVHYQKIIAALQKTIELQSELEKNW